MIIPLKEMIWRVETYVKLTPFLVTPLDVAEVTNLTTHDISLVLRESIHIETVEKMDKQFLVYKE